MKDIRIEHELRYSTASRTRPVIAHDVVFEASPSGNCADTMTGGREEWLGEVASPSPFRPFFVGERADLAGDDGLSAEPREMAESGPMSSGAARTVRSFSDSSMTWIGRPARCFKSVAEIDVKRNVATFIPRDAGW